MARCRSSSEGNLDHPQFQWLESELEKATTANELVILYSHHAPASFQSAPIPDENAPACTHGGLARARRQPRL